MLLKKKMFFDYYAVTVNVPRETLMLLLRTDIVTQHAEIQQITPRYGYAEAYKVNMPDLSTIFTFMLGGQNGQKTHCFASGENADPFYRWLGRNALEGELTRADVAVDFDEPSAWLSLYQLTQHLESVGGYTRRYIGPALSEVGDCKKGRTIYVGSRFSAGMVRLYEKGKKDDSSKPDWCRWELEIKPQNPNARTRLYLAEPFDVWSSHKLGQLVLDQFGQPKGLPLPLSRIQPRHDHDIAFSFMCDQYRRCLLWKLEQLGGDYLAFVDAIFENQKKD